ncbi:MAG: hypothetical protein ACXAEU_11085 [Candidatus Hodarchaeales archaeon]|jgi:hypothetical protein
MLRKKFPVVIILIIISTITSVQASIAWKEDFTGSLDEWDLSGYTFNGNFQSAFADSIIDPGFTIENGSLVGPLSTTVPWGTEGNWSLAMHESDVAFGSWSFDLFMEKSPINQILNLEIAFIFSDPVLNYEWLGETNDKAIKTSEGYILFINNIFLSDQSSEKIIIDLDKHRGGGLSRINLDEARFDVDFDNFHQINITRTLDYKIEVYFDGELKLEVQESESTALTSSEQFVFFHWGGKFKLDNISVIDLSQSTSSQSTSSQSTSSQPTSTSGFLFILSSLSILVLVITRRKK